MPGSTKKRERTQHDSSDAEPTQKQISEYELSREERIKENHERMKKFGIVDLSRQLRSSICTKRNPQSNSKRKTAVATSPAFVSTAPPRRSSRLQNATPISYAELPSKLDESTEHEDIILEEGSRPEFYTEEHENLLGDTELSWELFVDGYGKDGKRIYDQVKGKTCHQCRQKTLGHRTSCSQCNMVQGQFCGDCLYMRYGEHVLEAQQNPNWICPPCRGICNCSLCRKAKGWAPTGYLYRKITSLGYKSVAHYLIQTRRLPKNKEANPDGPGHVPVKRSLPFSDVEPASKDPSELYEVGHASTKLDSCLEVEEEESHLPVKRSLPFSSKKVETENGDVPIVSVTISDDSGLAKPEHDEKLDEFKNEKEKVLDLLGEQQSEHQTPVHQKSGKKRKHNIEPNPDSIGGRLRLRRRSSIQGAELSGNNQVSRFIHPSHEDVSRKQVNQEIQMNSACKGNIISNVALEASCAAALEAA